MAPLPRSGLLERGAERLKQLFDPQERARLFPASQEGIFLAHAAVAPISGPAQEAMDAWAASAARGNQENDEIWARARQTRHVAAQFIGCQGEEVSLLGPTALGLSLVALGCTWQKGDEVIYDPFDYPANVYPWMNLARQGVRPVPLQRLPATPITWETVRAVLTPKTRLVSLATAHYLSGLQPDLATIGPELQSRKIMLCLDAIQTLGVLPTQWPQADFLAADAHKWMLGPVGAGVFMVRQRVAEQLAPALLGSWNVVSPEFLAQPTIQFEAGGRRYEPGSLNLPGIEGMRASLELLHSFGPQSVADHALHLARLIRQGALAAGFSIYGGGEDQNRAITCLLPPARGWSEIKKRMAAARIRLSWREEHGGKILLRVSPHVGNTAEEVATFLEVLGRAG